MALLKAVVPTLLSTATMVAVTVSKTAPSASVIILAMSVVPILVRIEASKPTIVLYACI